MRTKVPEAHDRPPSPHLCSTASQFWTHRPASQALDATHQLDSVSGLLSPNCSSFRGSSGAPLGAAYQSLSSPVYYRPPCYFPPVWPLSDTPCLQPVSSEACQFMRAGTMAASRVHSPGPSTQWVCRKCLQNANKWTQDGKTQSITGWLSAEALPPPPGRWPGSRAHPDSQSTP